MPRWGMVIDLDKCTACQSCTVACRVENNVPIAGPRDSANGRAIFWNEVISVIESEGTRLRGRFIPRPCMHCENPPCVQVCPVGATFKDAEGIVRQDYERCIGCRYCTVACPYGARYFNWRAPEYSDTHALYRNPDAPARPRPVGVVEKCTFCVQRIERARRRAAAEGRELRDGEVAPACVQTCPGRARVFGDFDDERSQVSRLARSPRAFRFLEELGTRPQVVYLMEG
jgi:Fe-S-cluster-containing dehydrogenase component